MLNLTVVDSLIFGTYLVPVLSALCIMLAEILKNSVPIMGPRRHYILPSRIVSEGACCLEVACSFAGFGLQIELPRPLS